MQGSAVRYLTYAGRLCVDMLSVLFTKYCVELKYNHKTLQNLNRFASLTKSHKIYQVFKKKHLKFGCRAQSQMQGEMSKLFVFNKLTLDEISRSVSINGQSI